MRLPITRFDVKTISIRLIKPSRTILINALIKLLPDYIKLQQLINETLHSQLPKNFCKKAHRIAIDFVLIPYHGEHQYHVDEVYRSQPKSGTSHFHVYVTACIVVHKGNRYTVALIPVAKGTPMKEVVQALLKRAGMMNEKNRK